MRFKERFSYLRNNIKYWEKRDWVYSTFVAAGLTAIIGTAGTGFVSANYNSHESTQEKKPVCPEAIDIARMRRTNPGIAITAVLAQQGYPLQVYIKDGNYFQSALTEEQFLRTNYKADILVNFADSHRNITEGSYELDRQYICRVVVYKPRP